MGYFGMNIEQDKQFKPACICYIYDEIQPKELSLKSISPWPRIIWMDSSLLFLELQTILLK